MARRDRDRDRRRDKDEHHHDKDHKPPRKPPPKPGSPPPAGAPPGNVTESLKALSTQSGQDAMNAVPGGFPADPANAEAVYTTGPGQAVEYNYQRLGTYSEEYARQQSEQMAAVPPVAGSGQVVTSGAANNPT